jgi:hypothetical protein
MRALLEVTRNESERVLSVNAPVMRHAGLDAIATDPPPIAHRSCLDLCGAFERALHRDRKELFESTSLGCPGRCLSPSANGDSTSYTGWDQLGPLTAGTPATARRFPNLLRTWP